MLGIHNLIVQEEPLIVISCPGIIYLRWLVTSSAYIRIIIKESGKCTHWFNAEGN